ncbi:MAG: hypothetical protein ABII96_04785 [Candidatus Zixiibacteriota bacterium]
MLNMETIKSRYMQDGLDKRLGGIAANLTRIASFSVNPQNWEAVQTMLEETEFFIEWAVPDAPLNVQVFLVEVQVQMSLWHRNWPMIYSKIQNREKLQQWSRLVSEKVLMLARETCATSPSGI